MPRSTTHWFDDAGAARLVEEERVRLEPGAKVEGTIVDAASGEPIAAAEVRAGSESDEPDAISDERGSFRFWVDMSTRALKVRAKALRFEGTDADLALWNGVVIDPPSVTLRLHRREPGPRGTVDVTVLDAWERPLESALVWLEEIHDPVASPLAGTAPPGAPEIDERAKVKTDADGHGLVPDVRIGRTYRVCASRRGHVAGRATTPVRFDAGKSTGHAIVVLEDLGSFVVTVLDPMGEPVTGFVDFRADLDPGAGRRRRRLRRRVESRAPAPPWVVERHRGRNVPLRPGRAGQAPLERPSRRVPLGREFARDPRRQGDRTHAAARQGSHDSRDGGGPRGTSRRASQRAGGASPGALRDGRRGSHPRASRARCDVRL